MTHYVLLAVADDAEAMQLIEDMVHHPHAALLSPVQEHAVHAQLLCVADDLPSLIADSTALTALL